MREFFHGTFEQFARMETTRREIILASFLMLLIFFVGTMGYRALEGWPVMDAVYMTFITLTTIGFAEIHTLSYGGRIFTMFIAFFGIGTAAFIATRATQLLIVNQRIRERHIMRMIDRLSNHYIICGYGRIGRRISRDLLEADTPFVVIDNNPEKIEVVDEEGLLYIEGNAEEEETLKRAGIERAQGIIVSLPEDSDNVFVTLIARELNPSLFVLTRTNAEQNARKMSQAGADKVISPYEIGADRMAQVILRPHLDRFMEQVLGTGPLGLRAEEVVIEEGSPLANKTLAESNFRQQFDTIVIAIVNEETNEIQYNPAADTRLQVNDVLIVLGNEKMIERLRIDGCTA